MEYIQKHVTEPPSPLSDRVPGLKFPKGLDDVIAKALAKNPRDRYQSAIEFAAALLPFAGASAVSVEGIFQMTPAPPSVATAMGAALPARAATKGPSVGLLAAVAVVCLIVGVVLAVAVMKVLGK